MFFKKKYIMNNQNQNPNEAPHQGKPVEEFKKDELLGTEIKGGGKGTVILPTADEPGVTDVENDGNADELIDISVTEG